jgi:hypothetical protein
VGIVTRRIVVKYFYDQQLRAMYGTWLF